MKRTITLLAGLVLALTGLAATAQPAAAGFNLAPGWSAWTREYCEDGTFVNMRRLDFSGRGTQGREYLYRRSGRLCAFTVDRLPGSHWIDVTAHVGRSWGTDGGFYTEYAGAVAAPAGRCIQLRSSLQIPGNGTTYLYGTRWRRFC